MNRALFFLNAIALAVVVMFHFQSGSSASTPAHYAQHQAPQVAVISDHSLQSAQIASDTQVQQLTRQHSESWVF
ncbi:hypothetical protein ACN1C3_32785 [Pseudomonas sp. H11T01]|uniref:hypothetical protein n=1 Tax=Pseudomonas sp. H11T01 TaxID=3402749 RepID=UPI003AD38023